MVVVNKRSVIRTFFLQSIIPAFRVSKFIYKKKYKRQLLRISRSTLA